MALAAAGITVRTTAVGDRYVLEEMLSSGFSLGGERSGHVILSDLATTGDGLLTALHLMSIVASTGRPLAELAAAVPHFPQVLINVPVTDKSATAAEPDARRIAEQVVAAVAATSADAA